MRKILLACAAVLVMSAVAAALAGHSSRLHAFVASVTASTSGARPAPVIYRPAKLSRSKAVPLVIALHGAGSSPAAFERWTGLDQVAAQHGFVVAYLGSPNPLWKSLSNNQYVSAMIRQLTASQNIDPSRVYVVGFSLGGVETFRAGCYLSRQVAAIAAVSQGMPAVSTSRCPVARPVSVLNIVGSHDIVTVHPSAGSVLSADAAAGDWRTFDACPPHASISRTGPVIQTVWTNCNDATSVGEYVGAGRDALVARLGRLQGRRRPVLRLPGHLELPGRASGEFGQPRQRQAAVGESNQAPRENRALAPRVADGSPRIDPQGLAHRDPAASAALQAQPRGRSCWQCRSQLEPGATRCAWLSPTSTDAGSPSPEPSRSRPECPPPQVPSVLAAPAAVNTETAPIGSPESRTSPCRWRS